MALCSHAFAVLLLSVATGPLLVGSKASDAEAAQTVDTSLDLHRQLEEMKEEVQILRVELRKCQAERETAPRCAGALDGAARAGATDERHEDTDGSQEDKTSHSDDSLAFAAATDPRSPPESMTEEAQVDQVDQVEAEEEEEAENEEESDDENPRDHLDAKDQEPVEAKAGHRTQNAQARKAGSRDAQSSEPDADEEGFFGTVYDVIWSMLNDLSNGLLPMLLGFCGYAIFFARPAEKEHVNVKPQLDSRRVERRMVPSKVVRAFPDYDTPPRPLQFGENGRQYGERVLPELPSASMPARVFEPRPYPETRFSEPIGPGVSAATRAMPTPKDGRPWQPSPLPGPPMGKGSQAALDTWFKEKAEKAESQPAPDPWFNQKGESTEPAPDPWLKEKSEKVEKAETVSAGSSPSKPLSDSPPPWYLLKDSKETVFHQQTAARSNKINKMAWAPVSETQRVPTPAAMELSAPKQPALRPPWAAKLNDKQKDSLKLEKASDASPAIQLTQAPEPPPPAPPPPPAKSRDMFEGMPEGKLVGKSQELSLESEGRPGLNLEPEAKAETKSAEEIDDELDEGDSEAKQQDEESLDEKPYAKTRAPGKMMPKIKAKSKPRSMADKRAASKAERERQKVIEQAEPDSKEDLGTSSSEPQSTEGHQAEAELVSTRAKLNVLEQDREVAQADLKDTEASFEVMATFVQAPREFLKAEHNLTAQGVPNIDAAMMVDCDREMSRPVLGKTPVQTPQEPPKEELCAEPPRSSDQVLKQATQQLPQQQQTLSRAPFALSKQAAQAPEKAQPPSPSGHDVHAACRVLPPAPARLAPAPPVPPTAPASTAHATGAAPSDQTWIKVDKTGDAREDIVMCETPRVDLKTSGDAQRQGKKNDSKHRLENRKNANTQAVMAQRDGQESDEAKVATEKEMEPQESGEHLESEGSEEQSESEECEEGAEEEEEEEDAEDEGDDVEEGEEEADDEEEEENKLRDEEEVTEQTTAQRAQARQEAKANAKGSAKNRGTRSHVAQVLKRSEEKPDELTAKRNKKAKAKLQPPSQVQTRGWFPMGRMTGLPLRSLVYVAASFMIGVCIIRKVQQLDGWGYLDEELRRDDSCCREYPKHLVTLGADEMPKEPSSAKPRVVLYAPCLFKSYVSVVRKYKPADAAWYFKKGSKAEARLEIKHRYEDTKYMRSGIKTNESIMDFLEEHATPKFGQLTSLSYDGFIDNQIGLGIVAVEHDEDSEEFQASIRPMMLQISAKFDQRYTMTWINAKDAASRMWLRSEFRVTRFPAFIVQREPVGSPYIRYGELSFVSIANFLTDVWDQCVDWDHPLTDFAGYASWWMNQRHLNCQNLDLVDRQEVPQKDPQ